MPDKKIEKRKRKTKGVAEDTEDCIDAKEIFKRHFESQFAPLKETVVKKAKKKRMVDEWQGLSEEEVAFAETSDKSAPEVIEFTGKDPLLETTKLPKSILKPFISSKPPSLIPSTALASKSKIFPPGDDEDEDTTVEASLLKNDLALQRLLRESHLLDSSSETLEATGKNRLKALESRVQSLGGKDITVQKMPMAARKAIDAARKRRELKRRKHAKEAGVILEKEVRVKKDVKKRERGFGPSIGSFKNGTLVLSRRDVMDIEGRTGGGGSGGKGKGKGKGKGSKGGKGGKRGKKRR